MDYSQTSIRSDINIGSETSISRHGHDLPPRPFPIQLLNFSNLEDTYNTSYNEAIKNVDRGILLLNHRQNDDAAKEFVSHFRTFLEINNNMDPPASAGETVKMEAYNKLNQKAQSILHKLHPNIFPDVDSDLIFDDGNRRNVNNKNDHVPSGLHFIYIR